MIKRLVATGAAFSALFMPLAVRADCTTPDCLKLSSPKNINLPQVNLSNGLQSVLGIVAFIAGIVSVFFIVTAGIKYAGSSGDPSRIESAKSTLLYAVIGLIISIIAPIIITFVVSKLPS